MPPHDIASQGSPQKKSAFNERTNADPQEQIHHAARIISSGGVVIFPTQCLYGLAADALNPEAVARIFEIKQRPAQNPLLILIDHPDWLKKLVKEIPMAAQPLMDAFWPGNLTLVFKAKDHLPRALTAGTGKIGIRMPWHPVAKALVRACDGPITGTSANRSGAPGCREISRMDPDLIGRVDWVLDGGRLKGGVGSTVVDLTGDILHVVREGEVKKGDLLKTLKS